jgi:hypothetical protein
MPFASSQMQLKIFIFDKTLSFIAIQSFVIYLWLDLVKVQSNWIEAKFCLGQWGSSNKDLESKGGGSL